MVIVSNFDKCLIVRIFPLAMKVLLHHILIEFLIVIVICIVFTNTTEPKTAVQWSRKKSLLVQIVKKFTLLPPSSTMAMSKAANTVTSLPVVNDDDHTSGDDSKVTPAISTVDDRSEIGTFSQCFHCRLQVVVLVVFVSPHCLCFQ